MKVETYEVTELTTEGRPKVEVDAVAIQLIEDLDLEGQRKLLVKSEDSEENSRLIPYHRMTKQEFEVYNTLYPDHVGVADYSAGPIPVRVLQVIAHARELFKKVQIWGPEIHDPDPILVGSRTPPGQTYGVEYFLLARWGDALAPFDELLERAHALLKRRWVSKAQGLIKTAESFIAYPDALVEEKLSGKYVNEPWT